ncbi:MAG: hypothetical protein Q8L88_11265, partial [Bacteroidota bacterium]|nr:hypothetical protein [Bacteroidota bacterium]
LSPFVVKIFIPLFIVVLMSMLSFYIPAKDLESQIALGSTALLSIIALNFVIADKLPQVDYLIKSDKLLLVSYLFIFLALVESIIVNVLATKRKNGLALKFDKICRRIFPSLYVIFIIIFFWIL